MDGKDNGGCSYGKVNRTLINGVKDSVDEIKGEIRGLGDKISNELAHRLPAWVTIVISSLTLLIGILCRYIK